MKLCFESNNMSSSMSKEYLFALSNEGGEPACQNECWEDPGDRVVVGYHCCLRKDLDFSSCTYARSTVTQLQRIQGLQIQATCHAVKPAAIGSHDAGTCSNDKPSHGLMLPGLFQHIERPYNSIRCLHAMHSLTDKFLPQD